MKLRVIPTVFALLLLAAHFLRGGNYILTAACALLPLLLLVRRRMALRVIQCALAAGVAVWIHTAIVLTQTRMEFGAPWLRMLLILSAVSLLTGCCALLLNTDAVKSRFAVHGGGTTTNAVQKGN